METSATRSLCPISQLLDLLGDRWSLLIIRDAVLFGKSRYSEFLAGDEGISTNILARRLKLLVTHGVLEKHPDPEDGKSFLYLPTDEGLALLPVIVEILRWGVNTGRVPDELDPPEFMRQLVVKGPDWFRKQRAAELAETREQLA